VEALLSIVQRGGLVLLPIAVGSLVGVALFLERFFSTRQRHLLPKDLNERIISHLKQGQIGEAAAIVDANKSLFARVLRPLFRETLAKTDGSVVDVSEKGSKIDNMRTIISDSGRNEIGLLERNIEYLGTIAAVEPLLGLLGTVLGLIRAFHRVEILTSGGQSAINPGVLAAGIWEALLTTAAGLMVAIPTYLGYRYLQGKVASTVGGVEIAAYDVARLLSQTTTLSTGPKSPQP